MKKLLSFLLLCSCICIQKKTLAQENTGETADAPKSYYKIGMTYINDNVYLGRKDSVKIPYLTPSVSYYHKSGLYVTGSLSYLPTAGESRIDVIDLEAGYEFTKKKLDGSVSINKSFYSGQSYSVKSEVTASTSASLGYDFGFIKPTVNAFINFGTNNDYGLTAGIEHSFSMADDKVTITPSFLVNAATQNYYNSYYQKRRYGKTRKGKNVAYDITASALNVNNFKIMDYEYSIPVEYTAGKFTFSFTPSLAIPVNPNQVLLNIKTSGGQSYSKLYTEKLANPFYWAFSIVYKLD